MVTGGAEGVATSAGPGERAVPLRPQQVHHEGLAAPQRHQEEPRPLAVRVHL